MVRKTRMATMRTTKIVEMIWMKAFIYLRSESRNAAEMIENLTVYHFKDENGEGEFFKRYPHPTSPLA